MSRVTGLAKTGEKFRRKPDEAGPRLADPRMLNKAAREVPLVITGVGATSPKPKAILFKSKLSI